MPFQTSLLDLVPEQEPVVVPADASIYDAVSSLQAHRIGSVVVVEGRRPVGMFTERDLLLKVTGKVSNLKEISIKTVMSQRIVTLGAKDSIGKAIAAMRGGNFRHLPLVDEQGELVRVLSLKDVVNFVADNFDLSV